MKSFFGWPRNFSPSNVEPPNLSLVPHTSHHTFASGDVVPSGWFVNPCPGYDLHINQPVSWQIRFRRGAWGFAASKRPVKQHTSLRELGYGRLRWRLGGLLHEHLPVGGADECVFPRCHVNSRQLETVAPVYLDLRAFLGHALQRFVSRGIGWLGRTNLHHRSHLKFFRITT